MTIAPPVTAPSFCVMFRWNRLHDPDISAGKHEETHGRLIQRAVPRRNPQPETVVRPAERR